MREEETVAVFLFIPHFSPQKLTQKSQPTKIPEFNSGKISCEIAQNKFFIIIKELSEI